MSEWTIRAATLDDRGAAIDLMVRAFGPDEHQAELWDWAFAENPLTSDLYYLVADTGSGLAAQYAAMPVAVQHQGRVIRGLISLFTATDPAFQRRGLFRALAERLYAEAGATCPIVFGFPNERSAPSFYKHLGWVDLRPYPQLRRPLRNWRPHGDASLVAALGAGLLDAAKGVGRDSNVEVEETLDFTGIADGIWRVISPGAGTAVIRNEAFLNWRFVRSPFQYRRVVALRDGKPVGLAVLASGAADGKARLMELMVVPTEKLRVTRTLLDHVIKLATVSGAFAIGFVATPRHPQWGAMLAQGFLPKRPVRVGATPIDAAMPSFGVRVIGPGVTPSCLMHIDDWYLSSADQDWL